MGLLIPVLLMASSNARAQALDPAQIGKVPAARIGVPELRLRANEAWEQGDHAAYRDAMAGLHELRPNNSDYMYQLVLAYALLDEKAQAFNIMMKMQRQGLNYDFNESESSQNLRSTQLYTHLNDLMISAGEPLGTAEVIATLPEEAARPEGIDWDPGREAFLLGTVSDGAVLAQKRDGTLTELLKANNENGLWGIYGLAVDTRRNRLWLISASTPEFAAFDPVDKGRSALFEFNLESLELIKRYPVPVDGLPHSLRSITVAPNGDIYVADGLYPIVYQKGHSADRLRPVLALKELVSLRGMDMSDDGRLLFISDYELGVVSVDTRNGKTYPLAVPDTLNVGGIAGINYWNGRLLIIQNGIRPQRIMSLELDPSGRSVVNVAPVAVSLDVLDYPTYGTVVDDELVFFANSHWARQIEDAEPIRLATTSLSSLPAIVAPDMEKFMREYKASRGAGSQRKLSVEPEADTPEVDPPEK
jgi:hypothetical protein